MQSISLLKKIVDPRRIAWVTWSFLSNNTVNKTLYLGFCLIDLALIVFYSLILVSRIHYSNLAPFAAQTYNTTIVQSGNSSSSIQQASLNSNASDILSAEDRLHKAGQDSGGGIQLWFMREVDHMLMQLAKDNIMTFFASTILIMSVSAVMVLIVFVMALVTKNHVELDRVTFIKRVMCLLLVMFQTFLFMPMLDIIARTTLSNDVDSTMINPIYRYVFGSCSAVTVAIVMIYVVRLFNICVPSELIPWCSPISEILFLNILIKAILVISAVTDQQGKYAIYEIAILFVLQGFQACYRLLFAPSYLQEVDFFIKTKDFTIALIFFVGLVCRGLDDSKNLDIVYMLLFIPIVTLGWVQFEVYRKESIIKKIKNKSLKLEIEYELGLYVMMTLVRDSAEERSTNQKIFGQLMDLMLAHVEDCDDQLCICDEIENFYELLRLKQLHNQEVFPLIKEERLRYRKIIDDQGLIGTVSNLTDMTIKTKQSSSSSSEQAGINGSNKQNTLTLERADLQNIGASETKIKKNKKKPKKSRRIYKIDINETRHRFLSELLYLYYYEMKNKFPQSFKIQLLSNFFALQYKRKEMLCVFQMRSFIKSKLSKIDQCCHYINECYLLNEISKVQKVQMFQQSNYQEGNFNGEYFIKVNELYRSFNDSIERLSSSTLSFWRVLDRPNLDVKAVSEMSGAIAGSIKEVFSRFTALDTLKVLKDYQMYFQFAILQLHVLNDPMAYELYIGKMRSILEINKVYQKNFSNEKNSDNSNFIIVDANGARFGAVIQMNNNLRQLLDWSQSDVRHNRIENFMPDMIREKHNEFMLRYNKTGQSFIINNKTTMFLKKANGFVIAVELYIKFHYSIDYDYTFLAIVNPFYEISPFTNGIKYNTDQLMFFLVDNSQGSISEFSESCKKILKFRKIDQQDGIAKNIQDFIIDFDFNQFKRTRQDRYLVNSVYEQTHQIDTRYFEENSDNYLLSPNMGAQDTTSNFTGGNTAYSNLSRITQAKCRIFEECYSGGVLNMNVFCLYIVKDVDKMTVGGRSSKQGNASSGHSYFNRVLQKGQNVSNGAVIEELGLQTGNEGNEIRDEFNNRDESASVTASTSHASSTTSMAEFRNFHSFSEQQTPRTLITIAQLVVSLYLIMSLIASINLGVNLARQKQSENDVYDVRESYNRMNWLSMNQLLARVLVNTANKYELTSSSLFSDRFTDYVKLQATRVEQLKKSQSAIQNNKFVMSQDFVNFDSRSNIHLLYITEQNTEYMQMEKMSIAMNLYIAKLTELNSFPKAKYVGLMKTQTLDNREGDPSYRPSHEEQIIYFIMENGNRELRQFAIETTEYYTRESVQHVEQNITSTKITAIISIVVILFIGMIIAPILTQAEIRKYKAFLYFLRVPKEKYQDMIKNCEYCLNMNDEGRYYQILKDYERFLGVKLVGQQVEELKQAREQKSNIDNQSSKDEQGKSSDLLNSGPESAFGGGTINDADGSLAASRGGLEMMGSIYSNNKSQAIGPNNNGFSSMGGVKQQNSIEKKQPLAIEAIIEDPDDSQSNDQQTQEVGEERFKNRENNNKFNINTLNLRQGKNIKMVQNKQLKNNHERDSNKSSTSSESGDQDQTQKNEQGLTPKQIEEQKERLQEKIDQENQLIENKVRMINQQAYRRRSTVVGGTLSIILGLSSYFIIAYFLAMQTFQQAANVIQDLDIIFYKGTCFDNAMNFMRGNIIRNYSLKIKTSEYAKFEVDASDYYINLCFQKEVQYNKLRTNMPAYFKGASSYFSNLESSNMCDFVYGNSSDTKDKVLFEDCRTSLNGILGKGLTNAFYFMYTQILKQNLRFQELGINKMRTKEALKTMILDPTIIQIIDLKAKILDTPLNDLKQKCMESVIKYIQELLNNFIIAFIVFILILTVAVAALIFLGFKVLRQGMWDTNIILKIIPFESLPRDVRVEIKDFFNS